MENLSYQTWLLLAIFVVPLGACLLAALGGVAGSRICVRSGAGKQLVRALPVLILASIVPLVVFVDTAPAWLAVTLFVLLLLITGFSLTVREAETVAAR